MKKLKILTVASWYHPDAEGGALRVASDIATGLANRGHEVHVLTSRPRPELPEVETIDGVVVHRYSTKGSRGHKLFFSMSRGVRSQLKDLCSQVKFDAVHVHHLFSAHAAVSARSCSNLPSVYTMHMPYFLEHLDRETYLAHQEFPPLKARVLARTLRWMDSRVLRAVDRIVVLSQFVKSLVERHFPSVSTKVVQIAGSVNTERFCPGDKTESKRLVGLPRDSRILLTIRRLEPRMGIETLLHAMKSIVAVHPDLLLAIAGRGSLQENLHLLTEKLGIQRNVQWMGFVPESTLPDLYRAADVFVLPTRALEGFGVATLEALSCGVPALGTNVGATAEILCPLDSDLVIPTAKPEDIASAVLNYLSRDDKEALSDRCRNFTLDRYSLSTVIDQYEQLFQEIV